MVVLIATIGQLFCVAAGLTSASRTWYAFSRDRGMPGWWAFRRLNRDKVPFNAVMGVSFFALLITIPALFGSNDIPFAFFAITGICTVGLYIAYILPGVPAHAGRRQVRAGPLDAGRRYKLVNGLAIFFVILVVFSLSLPYTPTGLPWNADFDATVVNYSPLAILVPLMFGVWYLVDAKNRYKGPVQDPRRGRGHARLSFVAQEGARGGASPRAAGTARDERGSAALEHPAALVVGHDLVEEPLLRAPVVEVVLVHRLAERLLGERAALPQVDRLAHRGRERLRLAGLVGVALQLRAGIGLVLDPVEPRGEHRREGEVGVRVGARDAALDPRRLAVADDAEAAGAVVAAPRDRGRRPALGRVALVGVDRRRDRTARARGCGRACPPRKWRNVSVSSRRRRRRSCRRR